MSTKTPTFGRLVSYLDDEMEFEAGMYNDAYLDRRISARMRRVGADTYDEYLSVLRTDQEERGALRTSLNINVTEFFRNPKVWSSLCDILGGLASKGSVNAWSAPCADGREPYSLSMLAMDAEGVDADRVSILATDIDEDALSRGRRGVYGASATQDIAAELAPLDGYDPYVDRDGDSFAVRDAVSDRVTFDRHDLVRDGPKEGFDLVLCRNFLIYIDSSHDRDVIETLLESIRPGGVLVIGTTERLPKECRDSLEPIHRRQRIYRKRE